MYLEFKAIALGADAVCIGRPYVYGLAVAGAEGVEGVIRSLLAELDITMGLAGYNSLDAIKGVPGVVIHDSHLSF
jgi:lactate 2-monooxygenase